MLNLAPPCRPRNVTDTGLSDPRCHTIFEAGFDLFALRCTRIVNLVDYSGWGLFKPCKDIVEASGFGDFHFCRVLLSVSLGYLEAMLIAGVRAFDLADPSQKILSDTKRNLCLRPTCQPKSH